MYRERYRKESVEEDRERNAKLEDTQRKMDLQCDLMKEKMNKGMDMYVEYHHKCHEIERQWLKVKCELMEQKMGLMTDREELQKKIEEQKQLQRKFDELKAEVKELRKLKYAADRKAKGPVGVAR